MTTSEIVAGRTEIGDLVIRGCRAEEDGAYFEIGWAPLRAGGVLIVGSGAAADLPLPEPTVSQRHLRLEHRLTHVLATDLGSKNGTTLFGHRVERADLHPGARVGLGLASIDIVRAAEANLEGRSEPLPGLIGTSPPMLHLAERVRRFAQLSEPVLIRGESGTGKELVARALHDVSPRKGGPFVAINAASLSRELADSELFGHRRGAFTGAVSDRKGAFREASGGTLFVDEIAQLGLDVQAKLLRVVEERVVRPLGADCVLPVDVRLVAATCEPIEQYVVEHRFRPDLYQRIAVCVARVPPLRERICDLRELAEFIGGGLGIAPALIGEGAMRALGAGDYRGNVRELRSVLLHAALAAGVGKTIDENHVATAQRERSGQQPRPSAHQAIRAVEACGGNVSEAARRLGIARSTLRDLVASQKRPPTITPCVSGEMSGATTKLGLARA